MAPARRRRLTFKDQAMADVIESHNNNSNLNLRLRIVLTTRIYYNMPAIKLLVAFRMLMWNYNETRVAVYSACRLTNRLVKQKSCHVVSTKNLWIELNLGINSLTSMNFRFPYGILNYVRWTKGYSLPAGGVSRKEPYFVAVRPKTMAAFSRPLTVTRPLQRKTSMKFKIHMKLK